MPELPEIEVIKLGLQKKIVGLKIQKIQVLSPKSFIGNPDLAEGKTVLNIWRRAKLLGIDLAGNKLLAPIQSGLAISNSPLAKSKKPIANSEQQMTLLFHLKMSGQLVWKGGSGKGKGESMVGGHPTEDMLGQMPNKHTRVIFTLQSQESPATSHLYFNDQRKFGWIKIVTSREVTSNKLLGKLGPEPLEKEFTWQILKSNLLNHKSQPVKVAIMDQSVVAGVGNIYASEACFLAKIDPRKKVSELSDSEFKSLYQGITKSLQAGIKYGGSTRVHFVDPEGRKGYFLDYAKVYGKKGYSCAGCKGKVEKISLGGRGTFFCPACQR